MHLVRQNLLWIDCSAAVIAGLVVLAFSHWLSQLQALPQGLLIFIGIANLLYGAYSFCLAVRSRRPRALLLVLVAGNLGWAVVCASLGLYFVSTATGWGLMHLFGEALFVGGLAWFEWTWRDDILARGAAPPH